MCCGVAGIHRLDFFSFASTTGKVLSKVIIPPLYGNMRKEELSQLDLGLFTALVNSVNVETTRAGIVP